MRFTFLFAFLVVMVAFVSSATVDLTGDGQEADSSAGQVLSRVRRATCPWFENLCDIHCKSKGFSTGFCRGGTCTCKNK